MKHAGLRARAAKFGAIRRGFRDRHTFPFPLGSPLPEDAPATLLAATNVLDENAIEYFVADGTLLGIYRNARLIPHDTDLDVYTWGVSNWRQVKNSMTRQGFKVGRLVTYRGMLQQIAFYSRNQTVFDVTNWWHGGDGWYYNWLPELDLVRRHPARHFTNGGVVPLGDCVFRVPGDVEGWLEYVYGSGWRTPETAKTNWIETSRDAAPPEVSRLISQRAKWIGRRRISRGFGLWDMKSLT